MPKSATKVVQDNTNAALKIVAELAKLQVLVGIPSKNASKGREEGDPINNAELGYIHTYGSTIQVPAHDVTINRKIKKDGTFANDGRFTTEKDGNFQTTHEVQAYEVVIPPRPFLEPGIKNKMPKITQHLKKAAQAAMKGDRNATVAELTSAGLEGENGAKAMINDGLTPELAASTLAARRARGRTGTKPLEDTGALRNSITSIVRPK